VLAVRAAVLCDDDRLTEHLTARPRLPIPPAVGLTCKPGPTPWRPTRTPPAPPATPGRPSPTR
jgi:hypothetical protein